MKLMNKSKELATAIIRAYPSTHRRLKIEAAKRGVSISELLDILTKDLKD